MVGISDCLRLMMQCLHVLMLLLFVAIKTNISEACITVHRSYIRVKVKVRPRHSRGARFTPAGAWAVSQGALVFYCHNRVQMSGERFRDI